MTNPTPEQIEAGMTRDDAMKVAEAIWAISAVGNKQRFLEAAATVIQQAFAEREGEMREALEQSLQGWENIMELNLIPVRYVDGAVKLAKACRQALAAKGDSRG